MCNAAVLLTLLLKNKNNSDSRTCFFLAKIIKIPELMILLTMTLNKVRDIFVLVVMSKEALTKNNKLVTMEWASGLFTNYHLV